MGFANSVGIAQHIHRNVVKWSHSSGEKELRRDKPPTISKDMFRVYLDNWDEVRKVDASFAAEIEGQPSPAQVALRHRYSLLFPVIPRRLWRGASQLRARELTLM